MSGDRPAQLAVYRSSAWSTRVDLVVTDPGVVVEAARLLHQTLDRVDRVASRFRPDSEINRLHRSAGRGGRWRSVPTSARRSVSPCGPLP